MIQCSVCSCDFSLDEEGGIQGDFGILPVAFCPTCLSGMMDMTDQLKSYDEEVHHSDCPAVDGFGCRCNDLLIEENAALRKQLKSACNALMERKLT